MKLKLPLLIYDEDCPLCCRFKQGIEFLSSNTELYFVPLTSEEIYAQFPDLSIEQCRQTVHLITSNGELLKGPEVINYLVQLIPMASKFAWLLDSEAGKKAMNSFYEKIDEVRELLKKKEDCQQCPSKK